MVTVTVRETYDLSTSTNKMGLLAVHTPSVTLLKKLYPGLLLSYKYMKADSCNIALAAASLLPADPLQVGTEAGDIAPQDLFNPILYRAVSTDSFNTIINRTYGFSRLGGIGSLCDPSTEGSDPWSSTYSNSTDIYYSLLSESGWKKAMPQTGLVMRNVVPLVYEVLNSFGNTNYTANPSNLNVINRVDSAGTVQTATLASTFRGRARPLPRVPTLNAMTTGTLTSDTVNWEVPAGDANDLPKVPCVVIVMPPAKLHKLFFRMTVSWSITFSEVCSTIERATVPWMSNLGSFVHTSNYGDDSAKVSAAEQSSFMDDSNMTTKTDMIDTVDVDAKMIMQS